MARSLPLPLALAAAAAPAQPPPSLRAEFLPVRPDRSRRGPRRRGTRRQHAHEVVVDGEVIGTQTLFDDDPGKVLRVEMPIPERLTQGRERVRVGFRPALNEGSIGAIFDVRILKPASR